MYPSLTMRLDSVVSACVRQERCSDRQVHCDSLIDPREWQEPTPPLVSYRVFTLTHSPFSLPAPIAHSSDRARAVARGRTRAHDPISALDSDVMSGRPCISAHHLLLPITIMCTLRLWLANAHHLNTITTPGMRLCADRYRSPHKLGDDAAGQSPGSNYSLHRFVRAMHCMYRSMCDCGGGSARSRNGHHSRRFPQPPGDPREHTCPV